MDKSQSRGSEAAAAAGFGRKSRGQSQALQLLQASKSVEASKSAPAMMNAGLGFSLAPPLERSVTMSSGTESVVQSLLSVGSSSSGRPVRRIPIVEDSPQGIQLDAQKHAPGDGCSPAANPFDKPFQAAPAPLNPFNAARDPNGQQNSPNSELSLSAAAKPLAQPVPKILRKTPGLSWPELDSAATAHGLVKSLSTEARQHSGMLFSHGSFNQSLADSVNSLTLVDSQE